MQENQNRSRTRTILFVGAILLFALILWLNRHDLQETWDLLGNIDLRLALLLPLMQLTSYFFVSGYYQSMLKAFGASLSRLRTYSATIALNFVNQILPSGGASGTTYLIYAFRKEAPIGQLTLVQLGRYVLAFVTYVPVLVTAFIWLLVSDELNGNIGLIALGLGVITLPGTILFIAALRDRHVVDRFVLAIVRFVNRQIKRFRPSNNGIKTASIKHGLKDFHDGVSLLQKQGRKTIKPALYMLLSTFVEISIVYMSFVVIDSAINPGLVVVAFTAANIAGAISIIPGDVGVHELVIVAVLSFAGVPKETALAAALLYRVFNKVIVMAVGFGFYVRLIKPLMSHGPHRS